MTYTDRAAARVLLVDGAGRILLFHGGDPDAPGQSWWIAPGGGLDAGETRAQGAARELYEETGLRVSPAALGEPVFHRVAEFTFMGRQIRQNEEFFLYRVDTWQVDTTGFDAVERLSVHEHRWWTALELETTRDTIYPAELPGLLRRCLAASVTSAVGVPPGSSC